MPDGSALANYCQGPLAKIFLFSEILIFGMLLDILPRQEGVSRSSRNVRRGRGGRKGADRRAAALRTAKSCGPGAPMQAPSSRRCVSRIARVTVANAGSPGRAPISRKPSRREGRSVSACTCGQRAFAQIFCAGAVGACGHPVFPAPSACFERDMPTKPRTRSAARMLTYGYNARGGRCRPSARAQR